MRYINLINDKAMLKRFNNKVFELLKDIRANDNERKHLVAINRLNNIYMEIVDPKLLTALKLEFKAKYGRNPII